MNNLRFSSLLFFVKPAKTVVPQPLVRTLPRRTQESTTPPFSLQGIAAVLACPALFFLDVLSSSHIFMGVLFLVIHMFLTNERRTLVVLFATIASLMMVIDLRLFYGQPNTEMFVMDKVAGLIAVWTITAGILHARARQLKVKRKRKPFCNIRTVTPLPNRIASQEESKTVVRHMRSSKRPIDPYTLDLIQFIYSKSTRN
jgi:hypothetical protein